MSSTAIIANRDHDTTVEPGSEATEAKWQGYVHADSEVYYMVEFEAGTPRTIELVGETSDVDLWVSDETGRLVSESREAGGREYCCFTPGHTGLYTIWIENWLSPTGTEFEITVI